jgi:allophanate hydrolase
VAAARPGQVLRFAWVTAEEGEQLARAAEAETRTLLASVRPLLSGGVDEAALYAGNLVSGVLDALSSEHRPLLGDTAARKMPA